MPTILLIESSARASEAALACDGRIVARFADPEPMHHASTLPRFVEQLLATARRQGLTIDAVAVSGGPGSYTGLRIGVSTAKGLCYALQARLIAIDTLRLIALRYAAAHPELPADAVIAPMVDARRMEVYTGTYSLAGEPLSRPQAMIITPDGLADIRTPIYIVGSGAAKCAGIVATTAIETAEQATAPAACECMVRLADEAWEQGEFQDVAYYEPFYLKEFYTDAH